MIIGICGKSGSGKSTLANNIIGTYGDNVIHCDIDKVGHKVLTLASVQDELIKCFGEEVVKNSIVDRKKLGEKVFTSRNEMNRLSNITWKYMQIEIDKLINKNSDKLIVLDWILLPNSKYFEECDIRVLLDVPYKIRKERAMLRDNISESAFDLREKASIDYHKEKFDVVIKNNNKEEIRKLVKLI